jgi:hypothetical protein
LLHSGHDFLIFVVVPDSTGRLGIQPERNLPGLMCNFGMLQTRDYPTGKSSAHQANQSPVFLRELRKNIPLWPLLKSIVKIRHPVPQEGRFAVVTDVGAGCGGRSSDACNPCTDERC